VHRERIGAHDLGPSVRVDKIVKHFTLYGRRAGPESPTRRVSDRASRFTPLLLP